MNSKILGRKRRATKTRCKIKQLGMPRLTVHRTPKHIYAQLVMPDGKIAASASTLSVDLREKYSYGGNVAAAIEVGKAIALKIKVLGIDQVAFDRSGFKYHGRIRALADTARAQGLEF